jgi:hypothetical protein
MLSTSNQPLYGFCACEVSRAPVDGLYQVTTFFYPESAYGVDEEDKVARDLRKEDIALVHEFLLGLRDYIGPFDLSEYGVLPDDVVTSELLDRLALSSIDDTWKGRGTVCVRLSIEESFDLGGRHPFSGALLKDKCLWCYSLSGSQRDELF